MENILNSIKSLSLNLANYVTPVLKESSFTQTGYITPQEFVKAGDFLVHHCPTWKWTAASDKRLQDRYLPEDKQFLKLENVPCFKRAADLRREAIKLFRDLDKEKLRKNALKSSSRAGGGMAKKGEKEVGKGLLEEEEWELVEDVSDDFESECINQSDDYGFDLLTELDEGFDNQAGKVAREKSDNQSMQSIAKKKGISLDKQRQLLRSKVLLIDKYDNELVADMEEFEKSGETLSMLDRSVVDFDRGLLDTEKAEVSTKKEAYIIMPSRSYDLHVTYDNFYRTPRFWFIGRELKQGRPLSVEEMYEDVSGEHANKTVTIERHPYLKPTLHMPSVHPCRHAAVMKKLIETAGSAKASETEPDAARTVPVDWYLIIFLKFVQTVVPTIQYDFTRSCPF